MSDHATIDLVRDALTIAIVISSPILISGVAIGLLVSILQSVTQIQEQTLTMVPKLITMTIVSVLLLPWIVMKLLDFARLMFALQ